uniref:Uncharacterized protein n=1 Tax=Micrurus carvalhoi TaxID=3147026 RepID=A0A2H6NCR8_9SAUR
MPQCLKNNLKKRNYQTMPPIIKSRSFISDTDNFFKKIKKITMKVLNFMFIPSKDEDLSSNFDFLSIFNVPGTTGAILPSIPVLERWHLIMWFSSFSCLGCLL